MTSIQKLKVFVPVCTQSKAAKLADFKCRQYRVPFTVALISFLVGEGGMRWCPSNVLHYDDTGGGARPLDSGSQGCYAECGSLRTPGAESHGTSSKAI
jgi:hypothetical protein